MYNHLLAGFVVKAVAAATVAAGYGAKKAIEHVARKIKEQRDKEKKGNQKRDRRK